MGAEGDLPPSAAGPGPGKGFLPSSFWRLDTVPHLLCPQFSRFFVVQYERKAALVEMMLSGNFLWSRSHERFEVGLEAGWLVSAQEAGRLRGRQCSGQGPAGQEAGDPDFHSAPALMTPAVVNAICLSTRAKSPISQPVADLGASLKCFVDVINVCTQFTLWKGDYRRSGRRA